MDNPRPHHHPRLFVYFQHRGRIVLLCSVSSQLLSHSRRVGRHASLSCQLAAILERRFDGFTEVHLGCARGLFRAHRSIALENRA